VDTRNSVEITAELVEVAAENEVSGKEVICLLLSRNNTKIAERAVVMIAERFDTEVIGLLPDGRGDIRITKAIVEAVADNRYASREAMESLLSRGDVQITEGAVAAVACKFNIEMMELLLSRSDICFTESVATTVAQRFDTRVMRLLLGKGGELQITKAVVEAVASNDGNGKEVMKLLLSRNDTQVIELVMKRASSNEQLSGLLMIAISLTGLSVVRAGQSEFSPSSPVQPLRLH
jgi:hypothetical protein